MLLALTSCMCRPTPYVTAAGNQLCQLHMCLDLPIATVVTWPAARGFQIIITRPTVSSNRRFQTQASKAK